MESSRRVAGFKIKSLLQALFFIVIWFTLVIVRNSQFALYSAPWVLCLMVGGVSMALAGVSLYRARDADRIYKDERDD